MLKFLFQAFRPKSVEDPYQQLVDRYLRRIRQQHGRRGLPAVTGDRVGVVVSPWQRTAVPFYLVEWAIRLRREGLAVEFIWDVWPNETGKPTIEELAITRVLESASRAFGIPILIAGGDAGASVTASPRLQRLAFESVTRKRRCEPSLNDPEIATEERRLQERVARVRGFVAGRNYSWILLPGGVWSVSGVYWEVSQSLGIGLTTFDSGTGLLCFQHGGPAAHFPDLSSSMEMLAAACSRDVRVRNEVEKWVDARLDVRRRGDDEFRLQPFETDGRDLRADIVVPLNYRLDTAAMCRQRLFSSVNEWLRELVEWGKAHPHITIAVRQHPCEKIEAYRSKEDYSWIAESGPNLHFIAAGDPVNTYDLLEGCRVALPYSSRVGIEAAIFGKSVILGASSYYEKMSFACAPATRAEYFQRIEEALRPGAGPSAEQREAAYAAYFVAESFGLHKTHFTPMPTDFEIWAEWSPSELWTRDRNEVFFQAAVSRRPAAEILVAETIARWAAGE